MVDKDLMEQKKREYIEEQDRVYDELLKSLEKDIDDKIYDSNNKGYNCCEEMIDRSSFYRLLAYSKGKYDYEEEDTCWKYFFSEFLAPYVNNGFVVSVHRQYGDVLANEYSYYLIRFFWGDDTEGRIDFTESSYRDTREKSWIKRVWKSIFA